MKALVSWTVQGLLSHQFRQLRVTSPAPGLLLKVPFLEVLALLGTSSLES